jgi:hypothetical protein
MERLVDPLGWSPTSRSFRVTGKTFGFLLDRKGKFVIPTLYYLRKTCQTNRQSGTVLNPFIRV